MIDLDALERLAQEQDQVTLSSADVAELVDRARGLSEVHLVRGMEDNSEECSACGYETSEGHTHQECFTHGVSIGQQDENINCAMKLDEALNLHSGGYFQEALESALGALHRVRKQADKLVGMVHQVAHPERAIRDMERFRTAEAAALLSRQFRDLLDHPSGESEVETRPAR